MPKSKKQKQSAKERRAVVSKNSRKQEKVLDYFNFFTQVLQLQDYSFSERDALASTFLRNVNISSSVPSAQRSGKKENEAVIFLATRFLWIETFGCCPGKTISGVQQCRELLHQVDVQIASLTILMQTAQIARHRQRYIGHGSQQGLREVSRTVPENVEQSLERFEAKHALPIARSTFSCSRTILYLEAVLVTCLSIPTLRPMFLPIAEHKVIHIISKMLDYALGLELQECYMSEAYYKVTNPEAESGQPTAVEISAICTQVVLNFVSTVVGTAIEQLNHGWAQSTIGRLTTDFVSQIRMLLGAGPRTPEGDVGIANVCHNLRSSDQEQVASACLWLYEKRHEDGTSPVWGNLQDDQEFGSFLHGALSICDCSVIPAQPTCQKCLSRLQTALDSFLNRFPSYELMMNDASDIFREISRAFQENMSNYLDERLECCRCEEMIEDIQRHVVYRLDFFVLSHLVRIARLTGDFTKTISSSHSSDLLMKVLCKTIYRFNVLKMTKQPFTENENAQTTSTLYRSRMLKAVEDDRLLLKTLESYIRHESTVVGQLLEKESCTPIVASLHGSFSCLNVLNDQEPAFYKRFTDFLQALCSFAERNATMFWSNNPQSSVQPMTPTSLENVAYDFLSIRKSPLRLGDDKHVGYEGDISCIELYLKFLHSNLKAKLLLESVADARWGLDLTPFPDSIKKTIKRFDSGVTDTYATHFCRCATATMFLEWLLDTCSTVPMIRPFIKPLADSKIVQIAANLRDCMFELLMDNAVYGKDPRMQHSFEPEICIRKDVNPPVTPAQDLFIIDVASALTFAILVNFVSVLLQSWIETNADVQQLPDTQAAIQAVERYLHLMLGGRPKTDEMDAQFRFLTRALCESQIIRNDEDMRCERIYNLTRILDSPTASPFLVNVFCKRIWRYNPTEMAT